MLKLLLLIPLIGCLPLIAINTNSASGADSQASKSTNSLMRTIALSFSLLNLLVSIVVWLQFNSMSTEYQFVEEITYISSYHFNIGIDGISLYFVLLTTFITPICLLSN